MLPSVKSAQHSSGKTPTIHVDTMRMLDKLGSHEKFRPAKAAGSCASPDEVKTHPHAAHASTKPFT
jgi:hypothetical protein